MGLQKSLDAEERWRQGTQSTFLPREWRWGKIEDISQERDFKVKRGCGPGRNPEKGKGGENRFKVKRGQHAENKEKSPKRDAHAVRSHLGEKKGCSGHERNATALD